MRIFIILDTGGGLHSMIKICINCGIKIQIKDDILKYKCPKCKTEYEYIEYIDIKREIENVIENKNNEEQDNNS